MGAGRGGGRRKRSSLAEVGPKCVCVCRPEARGARNNSARKEAAGARRAHEPGRAPSVRPGGQFVPAERGP